MGRKSLDLPTMIRLHQSGLTLSAVARELGVSTPAVWMHFKKNNIPVHKYKKAWSFNPEKSREKLRASLKLAYAQGRHSLPSGNRRGWHHTQDEIDRIRASRKITMTDRPNWNKGLTKETDVRIKGYPSPRKGLSYEMEYGNERTKIIKQKMSEKRRGILFPVDKYPTLGWRGRPGWNKGLTKETDKRVKKCSDKIVTFYQNNPNKLKEMYKKFQSTPNKGESFVDTIIQNTCPNTFKYVGAGDVVVGGKIPDWIDVKEKKKIIEFFGNRWHTPDEEQTRKEHFNKYGYQTLVIWGSELKDLDMVKERIKMFGGDVC